MCPCVFFLQLLCFPLVLTFPAVGACLGTATVGIAEALDWVRNKKKRNWRMELQMRTRQGRSSGVILRAMESSKQF